MTSAEVIIDASISYTEPRTTEQIVSAAEAEGVEKDEAIRILGSLAARGLIQKSLMVDRKGEGWIYSTD